MQLDEFTDSFGPKSIFNFMIEKDFQLHTLGHHYVQSFPIVHHLEHILNVPIGAKILSRYFMGRYKKIDSCYNFFQKK